MIVILFVLGFIYLILGLIAYAHTTSNSKSDKWLAISPWWASYSSIYDEFGKKLAKFGKVILVLELVGFVFWITTKLG
jgi:hypothetical protein